MIPQYISSPFSHYIPWYRWCPFEISPHPYNPTAFVFRRAVSVRISSPWTLDSTTRTCPIPRCPALRMALRQQPWEIPRISHGHGLENPSLVGGDWNHGILSFSIYWECHHPNWISYFYRGVETTNQIWISQLEPLHLVWLDFPATFESQNVAEVGYSPGILGYIKHDLQSWLGLMDFNGMVYHWLYPILVT